MKITQILIFNFISISMVAQTTFQYDIMGNRIQKVSIGSNPIPTLSANPTTVSSNQLSTLSASGCTGGNYSWSTGHQNITNLTVYPCITTTYYVYCTLPSCPTIKTQGQVSVQQLSPLTSNILTSEKTGNWNDPTVWCCGRVPTFSDAVIIYPTHMVTVTDNTAKAKSLKMEVPSSGIKYLNGGILQIKPN